MNFSSSFAPFRHRRFALLWAGAFVSNIGTWMETVGVGILVTSETGKAGWTGLVAAAGFVPTALLAPLGGALADRVPRRTLLLVTTSFQILFAALLTFVASLGDPSPGLVTLIVLGAGCANAIGFPAFQSMLPDLVPRDELPGAVALSSAQWNLGRVIGPALAGLVIGLGGYELAFALNTLSFFAVFGVVASFRLPAPVSAAGMSILGSIREGARFVRGDAALRFVVGCMALNSLLAAPFIALIPAVALDVFHEEKLGTAALVTAQGIGAVCMGLALATLFGRFGTRRVLLGVLFSLPVALVLYALAPTLPLAVVAIFVVGGLYLGSLSSFTTVAQLRAPAELRGRVVSVLMMLIGALYPIGSIAQGAIADEIGLRATTTGAAVLLGALLLTWRILRPRASHAIGDTITTAAATGGLDAVVAPLVTPTVTPAQSPDVTPVPDPAPARNSGGG
ncbi:MAG TPA: MFS transporter [Acidimicrobiia bacterium]